MTAAQQQRTIHGWAATAPQKPLEPWTYDAAPLDEDDIEIQIECCGICHSDIHTIDSGWGPTSYPTIVGHEIVGKVTQLGKRAQAHLKVGDRVGVGAQCNACLHCHQCSHGHDNVCPDATFTYNDKHPNGKIAYGGYADYVRVPYSYAFKLPDALPSEVAAPMLCAGVTVYAPLKRHMFPGARVGVVGIGGLGHLAIQFARALGAMSVVALSTSDRKRKDAQALGATDFLLLRNKDDFARHAKSIDVILCTACSSTMDWDAYLSLLDARGKLVVVGIPEDQIKLNLASLIFAERSLVGSLIGTRGDIAEMLEFAARHKVGPWIEKVPMSNVNAALDRLRKGDVKYRFVLMN